MEGRKKLFTVILEFEGTTSVSQVWASSPVYALDRWRDGLCDHGTYGLTGDQASRLAKSLELAKSLGNEADAQAESDGGPFPTPVATVENVWCTSTLTEHNSLALLNIVETVSGS
jgi:hypothetical protein